MIFNTTNSEYVLRNLTLNHFLSLDDDNRITLQPTEGRSDCQNDYINACYINVSVWYFVMLICVFILQRSGI